MNFLNTQYNKSKNIFFMGIMLVGALVLTSSFSVRTDVYACALNGRTGCSSELAPTAPESQNQKNIDVYMLIGIVIAAGLIATLIYRSHKKPISKSTLRKKSDYKKRR
jgi:hypothetical protein